VYKTAKVVALLWQVRVLVANAWLTPADRLPKENAAVCLP
jgi:hypothetical protein